MCFLNRYEIDELRDRWAGHPTLGPATLTLVNLRDAVNRCSDGWGLWVAPVRAAARLQRLVYEYDIAHRRGFGALDALAPSAAEVRRAYTPLKAFRTRRGVAFDIADPEG